MVLLLEVPLIITQSQIKHLHTLLIRTHTNALEASMEMLLIHLDQDDVMPCWTTLWFCLFYSQGISQSNCLNKNSSTITSQSNHSNVDEEDKAAGEPGVFIWLWILFPVYISLAQHGMLAWSVLYVHETECCCYEDHVSTNQPSVNIHTCVWCVDVFIKSVFPQINRASDLKYVNLFTPF